MKFFFQTFVFSMVLVAVSSLIHGAPNAISVDNKDMLKALKAVSGELQAKIKKDEKDNNLKLNFGKVLEARNQIVKGVNYFVTFTADKQKCFDLNCGPSQELLCNVSIYQPDFKDSFKVTKFNCA